MKLDAISKEYHIKLAWDKTLVYFTHLHSYKLFIEKYTNKLPFYTYTPKGERTHAFVIRGLPDDAEAEEIKKELTELDIPVQSVVPFRNTRTPIFMCTAPKSVTLNDLRAKARYLLRAKAYFEPHINKKGLVQCKKCQAWGHATSNCYLGVRKCVKCAGDHLSSECPKDRSEPAKCINCKGNHPASSVDCPAYQREVDRLAAIREKDQLLKQTANVGKGRRYEPAPPPTFNAWTGQGHFPPLPTKTPCAATTSAATPSAAKPQQEPSGNRDDVDNQPEYEDPRSRTRAAGARGIPKGTITTRNRGRGGSSYSRPRTHDNATAGETVTETPEERQRPAYSSSGGAFQARVDAINEGQHYISEIADTMRQINDIVDFKTMSTKLKQLLASLRQCSTPFERAMAIHDYNESYNG